MITFMYDNKLSMLYKYFNKNHLLHFWMSYIYTCIYELVTIPNKKAIFENLWKILLIKLHRKKIKNNNIRVESSFWDKIDYNTTPLDTRLALGPNFEAPGDLRAKMLIA